MKQFFSIILVFGLLSCNGKLKTPNPLQLKENAEKYLDSQEYGKAIEDALEASEIFELTFDSLNQAESLYLVSRASALSGNFNNAAIYGEQGVQMVRDMNNYELEYKFNNHLSWVYFSQGRGFEETASHHERQLLVAVQLNNEKVTAAIYNNYSYDVTVAGALILDGAIFYMKYANDYYAESEQNNGRWYTLMNLTWQYRLKGELTESERWGRMASDRAKADQDRHAIIEANTNLGETLLAQNKLDEAKSFYDEALTLSNEKEDSDKYVFDVYYSRYLWEIGQKEEAIKRLEQSIVFFENAEVFYEMLGRAFLADYYQQSGDNNKAMDQIAVFKKPRAKYFSFESQIIANIVEARILANDDLDQASKILNESREKVVRFGASFLENKITELLNDLGLN